MTRFKAAVLAVFGALLLSPMLAFAADPVATTAATFDWLGLVMTLVTGPLGVGAITFLAGQLVNLKLFGLFGFADKSNMAIRVVVWALALLLTLGARLLHHEALQPESLVAAAATLVNTLTSAYLAQKIHDDHAGAA